MTMPYNTVAIGGTTSDADMFVTRCPARPWTPIARASYFPTLEFTLKGDVPASKPRDNTLDCIGCQSLEVLAVERRQEMERNLVYIISVPERQMT